MSHEVECCPNCRSSNFVFRSLKDPSTIEKGENERYRCEEEGCGHTFDRPDTKETKNCRGPNVGLAGTLAEIGERGAEETNS